MKKKKNRSRLITDITYRLDVEDYALVIVNVAFCCILPYTLLVYMQVIVYVPAL